jgi:hypothetical protein
MGNGMSNFTDFIGGGGGGGGLYGGVLEEIVLNQSQTWVPPRNGTVSIYVIGAGGSGGKRHGSANNGMATGGGAGGLCLKESLDVTTSGSFTVTIGAGGVAPYNNTVNQAGVAGGNSTVAGTGLSSTLTANGGAGGGFVSGEGNSGVNGGAGGTASNGDYNRTGGRGGNVAGSLGNYSVRVATGGGAVAIKSATGYNGGDFLSGGDNATMFGTGGAGIGGNGGGKIASGVPDQSWGGNGGGANHAALNWLVNQNVVAGGTYFGFAGYKSFEFKDASLIGAKYGPAGSGSNTRSSTTSATNAGGGRTYGNLANNNTFYSDWNPSENAMGCGGGGCGGGTHSLYFAGGFGGAFAGGGGTCTAVMNFNLIGRPTGNGGCGGGGGGLFFGTGNAYSGAAGDGGDGLVIIHYTAYA